MEWQGCFWCNTSAGGLRGLGRKGELAGTPARVATFSSADSLANSTQASLNVYSRGYPTPTGEPSTDEVILRSEKRRSTPERKSIGAKDSPSLAAPDSTTCRFAQQNRRASQSLSPGTRSIVSNSTVRNTLADVPSSGRSSMTATPRRVHSSLSATLSRPGPDQSRTTPCRSISSFESFESAGKPARKRLTGSWSSVKFMTVRLLRREGRKGR